MLWNPSCKNFNLQVDDIKHQVFFVTKRFMILNFFLSWSRRVVSCGSQCYEEKNKKLAKLLKSIEDVCYSAIIFVGLRHAIIDFPTYCILWESTCSHYYAKLYSHYAYTHIFFQKTRRFSATKYCWTNTYIASF